MKAPGAFMLEYFIRPLITAVRTLTVLPLPGRDAAIFHRALLFFPAAGILFGLCAWGALWGLNWMLPEQDALRAILLLMMLTLLTGALHLDGLADTADGFFGGHTKERRLEIMKDPRQGTFGVAAIVFDCGLKAALYTALLPDKPWAIPASLVMARSLQSMVLAFFPYARREGGTAAPFSGAGARGWALTGFVAIVVFTVAAHRDLPVGFCWIGAGLMAILTAFYSYRKIGGVTGDVVGAINEVVELGVLLMALTI